MHVLLITAVGTLYGVPLPAAPQWPALAVSLVLGAAAFCTLGVAVASLVRNAEAAPSVVQFVLFPLVFISGTYMPIHSALLNGIAGALPVKPFNDALLRAFTTDHTGLPWRPYGVLLLWGGWPVRRWPSGGSAGIRVRSDCAFQGTPHALSGALSPAAAAPAVPAALRPAPSGRARCRGR
ncbi:ABC transporter permease [Streptomyces sp. NPDC000941]